MLKWNKKRLMFLLISTFLPIGIFMTELGYNNLKNKEIISTMAVPATNRTIVIDAGHQRYLLTR